jgi:ketosteroid isomerase-like protein
MDTDRDAVLAANLDFYRAFAERDLQLMDRLWAKRHAVMCVHPGWSPLKDRAAILESWFNILANPDSPRIACSDDEAFLYGDMAIVLCEEGLPDNTLAATNVFVKEEGEWRIVHHHAGPIFARHADPPVVTKDKLN